MKRTAEDGRDNDSFSRQELVGLNDRIPDPLPVPILFGVHWGAIPGWCQTELVLLTEDD